MNLPDELKTDSIYIFGYGVTGKALSKFFEDQGIAYVVVEEGKFQAEDFSNSKVKIGVVSPGWKRNHPLLIAAQTAGIKLISEIDLTWAFKEVLAPAQKWVGVTGTNGKTTTVQMLESILNAAGIKSVACGNVGFTAIEALMVKPAYEVLILELSSFQLDWSDNFHLESAAILNIAQDHIDWHGSFENYCDAKFKITNFSKNAVLNRDDEVIFNLTPGKNKAIAYFYSLNTPAAGELGLVEEILVDRAFVADQSNAVACATLADVKPLAPHNVSNALAAIGIARSLGVSEDATTAGLNAFKIDAHRLSHVGNFADMDWVDDSKATNPHSAIAALNSFTKIIWIAGGLAKGADMNEVAQVAAKHVTSAILIGTDQELIKAALQQHAPKVKIVEIHSEEKGEALGKLIVERALELAEPGATVLLAPACASMDQFENYKARGDAFSNAVLDLISGAK